MNLDLSKKIALVTGSTSGIGLAIAEALQEEGCTVVLNGRTEAPLNAAMARLGGRPVAFVRDVSRPADATMLIQDVMSRFGRLDILVCNVGSGRSVPPGDETNEEWQRVFAQNFFSTTNTVEAARDALKASRGVVICVSSICGLEVVPGAPVTYSAAKAALNAYVRGMARPLGKHGVRINAVAPGNILFDGSTWSKKMSEDASAVQTMLERDVALARLGTPRNVAELVVYLASPRADFATGSVWTLDGGQVRRNDP